MGEDNVQFRKANASVYEVFLQMLEEHFPKLTGYSFGLLFNQKMKKSRGNLVFAYITQPTKLMSYFARNERGNPYDFLIVVDEMVWAVCKPQDKIRIIRHELRHVYIDEKGNAKLVDHDFQDFFEEVKLNKDEPDWTRRVAELTIAGYDQIKGKDPGKDPRDDMDDIPVEGDPIYQTQLPLKTKEDFDAAVDSGVKAAFSTLKPNNGGDADFSDMAGEKVTSEPNFEKPSTNLKAMAKKRGLVAA